MKPIHLFANDTSDSVAKEQYLHEISKCLDRGDFILGESVADFENNLSRYLSCNYSHSCGNGTDALWLAYKSLGLTAGDIIALPAFSYIAAAEVAVGLGLNIFFYDINPFTFNIDDTLFPYLDEIPNLKALVVVHLFGQSGNILSVSEYCSQRNILLIEDNAQSLGAIEYTSNKYLGTFGNIGTTSFFPTKPLGCFGDGGAIFTQDETYYTLAKQFSNHGQSSKYNHDLVGINSRLDTIQAAILNLRLQKVKTDAEKRQVVAQKYNAALRDLDQIIIPQPSGFSSHVYHQYTLRIISKKEALQDFLAQKGIPTAIHYPKVIYNQLAYKHFLPKNSLYNSEQLCSEVLSLPIHPYLDEEQITYITDQISKFFAQYV